MNKTQVENQVRLDYMDFIKSMLEQSNDTVLQVKSNTLSIPWESEEREGYINLTFSIPKGERGSSGYNGFEEAELFKLEQKEKEEKNKEKEKQKKKKIEYDKKIREQKRKEREEKLKKAREE